MQQKWIHINLSDADKTQPADASYSGYIVDKIDSDARTSYQNIQNLCDQLLPIYQKSNFEIGYIAAPRELFHNHDGFRNINHPNVMITLPASEAGLTVGQKLLFDGVSVFFKAYSLSHYEKAMKLYLRAIEDRDIHYRPLKQVRSFISFDVAAIDAVVNERLQNIGRKKSNLKNRAAIALAKLARQKYARYFSGESWTWLADHGAQSQPLLVDLSGFSSPQFYIDALSAHVKFFSMSMSQVSANDLHFDSAKNEPAVVGDAGQVLQELGDLGIHLDEIGEHLVDNFSE